MMQSKDQWVVNSWNQIVNSQPLGTAYVTVKIIFLTRNGTSEITLDPIKPIRHQVQPILVSIIKLIENTMKSKLLVE